MTRSDPALHERPTPSLPEPVVTTDIESRERRKPVGDIALVVVHGSSFGRRVEIGDAPVIVGRGGGVDLQLGDPTVSRHHCVVWRADGRCWVRDLGSTNQTRINDRSLPMAELFDGDRLLIGETILSLCVSRDADSAVRPSARNLCSKPSRPESLP